MRGWAVRLSGMVPGRLLRRCRRGTVALEYGLLSSVVAIAVTVGGAKLGASVNRTFTDIAARVSY